MALQRTTVLAFFALVLALGATAEAVYTRPMDCMSVTWFIALAAVAASATVVVTRTLFLAPRSNELRETLDGFFWTAFIALPLCVGLLGTAIWTLGWYFLGWE